MSGLMPPNILSYIGSVAVPFINRTFPPETTFNDFGVPTVWIDTLAENAYILVSKPLGVANWVMLGGVPGNLDTLTGDTGGAITPIANNINIQGGPGVVVAGNAGTATLTITVSGGGLHWVDVIAATQTLAANTGYVADRSSIITFTLPSTAAFGEVYSIVGKGVGGWTLAQNAGQVIYFGTATTTTGVGGSLSSTKQRNVINLLCITANTEFEVIDSMGTITVT